MYDKLAYALVPSGYKANKLYSFVGGDMSFTRATTATRINKDGYIELVPTGVPRLNYPLVNGVPSNIPELLLEPSRINLQVYSEDFSNAAWQKADLTVTPDAVVAPDGNTTADALVSSATTAQHFIYDSFTTTIGEDYSFSIWVRKGTISQVRVWLYQNLSPFTTIASVYYDLDIEDTIRTQVGDVKVVKYPNDWFKISITGEAVSTTTNCRVQLIKDEADSFAGTINDYLYVWGAQVELGSYPTSYIPTFDSTASRNAETANNATADFNDAEGVLYVEAAELNNDGVSHCISINNNNTTNRIIFVWQNTSNYINARVNSDTTSVYNHNQSVTDTTEFHKLAIRYKQDDFAFFVDGIKVDFQLSGETPIGLSDFSFDNGTNSSGFFYGRVRQVLYFNEALTDSELETLTT
jgi:hypothetical protein